MNEQQMINDILEEMTTSALEFKVGGPFGAVVYKDGKAVNITVLIDTGNLLIDPIGGGPVIVAEQNVLSPIVGLGDVYQKCSKISGMRLIPIQTVGCNNELLVGFKPDKICCKTPLRDDAIIAVAPNSFNADYNALAGPHSFLD